MMRMLLANAALLFVVAAFQPASAWTHVTFGHGKVFTWKGVDGTTPEGAVPGVPVPGQPGFDGSWGRGFGSPFAGVTFSNPAVAPRAVYGPVAQPVVPMTPANAGARNAPPPASDPISTNVPRRMPPAPDQEPASTVAPPSARPVSFSPYSYVIPGPMPFVDP